MRVRLPNGFIDGQDHFCYAVIDELRGKQQNYLANRELVIGNIGHVPKILNDMILSLETEQGLQWKGNKSDLVGKLASGDVETLLVKIRENTYGPRFYHEAECTHCQHVMKNLRLDLDKLELDTMSIEELMAKKVFKLPKSGKEVELKSAKLDDLFKVIKITKNKQDELITSLVSVAVKRIDDKHNITEKDIEEIPAMDLKKLQEEIEGTKLEGGIDTDIEITCDKCGKDYVMKLNCYDADFFDPSKGSASTNT